MVRTVNVPPGIGDNIWLIKKLINAGEQFNFNIPGSAPLRGKQIYDVCPQVAISTCYKKDITFSQIKRFNIQRVKPFFNHFRALGKFSIEANTHLENGRRIERFLPDLPTSYYIPWVTPGTVPAWYDKRKKYIGIYCSSYAATNSWKFWGPFQWLELITRIHNDFADLIFVFLGANWDADLTGDVQALLTENDIPFINTLGADLATTIDVLKLLHYFYAFPSGLPILAATVKCRATMFYPSFLNRMRGTWQDPGNDLIFETSFVSPLEIYNQTKYKL